MSEDYDKYVREKVEEALGSDKPSVPHDEAIKGFRNILNKK